MGQADQPGWGRFGVSGKDAVKRGQVFHKETRLSQNTFTPEQAFVDALILPMKAGGAAKTLEVAIGRSP
jgi:hypothetical protein